MLKTYRSHLLFILAGIVGSFLYFLLAPSTVSAKMPDSLDTNSRANWVNAYVISYDGLYFVNTDPNGTGKDYSHTEGDCTSTLRFNTNPRSGSDSNGQAAYIQVNSPAPSGGCNLTFDYEQKINGKKFLVPVDKHEDRDIFFFKDTDGNVKHVDKAGVIFAQKNVTRTDPQAYPPVNQQVHFWWNPTDADPTDNGDNPCRDIITNNNGWKMYAVEQVPDIKKVIPPERYKDYYDEIGLTPPASGTVCSLQDHPKTMSMYPFDLYSLKAGTGYGIVLLHVGSVLNAAASPNKDQKPADEVTPNATDDGSTSAQSTCKVDGIGWIVCPVLTFMGKIIDQSYETVGEALLTTPALSTDTKSPLYSAWAIMRNFANVAFVIAFLIIIFSQLTSFGVSNYGIKKLLPKLIVAAILVNLSYWVCAIAVDLSNIVGASINDLFNNISTNSIKINDKSGLLNGTTVWTSVIGGLLGGTAIAGVTLYSGLSVLLPLAITALVIIVTVVAVLTLRQALIILLIVVSPLAFVALLLPNTEGLFKKWRQMLQTLLLLFPIIGAVFGLSKLAGKIIMASSDNFLVQLMGAATQIIVLVLVYELIKGALKLFGRLGAFVNNPAKGPFDRMRKGAEEYRKNRQQLRDARALNGDRRIGGSFVRRKARRAAVLRQREQNYKIADASYIAQQAQSNERSALEHMKMGLSDTLHTVTGGRKGGTYTPKTQGGRLLAKMAQGGNDAAANSALASAISTQAKIEAEEVNAAKAIIQNLNPNMMEARALASGGTVRGVKSAGDSALLQAAREAVIGNGDIKGMNELIDQASSWDSKERVKFADALQASSTRPAYASLGALAGLRQGGSAAKSSQEMIEDAIRNNTYAPGKIASVDKDEIQAVAHVAATSQLDPDAKIDTALKQQLRDNANKALIDDRLNVNISKSKNNITILRDGKVDPGAL